MTAKENTYLDYNATCPLRDEAREAMVRGFDLIGNPSSIHSFGRKSRSALEKAREEIARIINAQPSNLIFTSSATEANNTILKGLPQCEKIFISAGEHPSVTNAVPNAEILPFKENGLVDLDHLKTVVSKETKPFLVSIQAVNSETGVIQPISEIANIIHQNGGLFHCDAVQALGRIELDYIAYGCDFMSLSAHKIGGPLGIGLIIAADLTPFEPFMHGGAQEKKRRAGTENLPAILGFEAALKAVDAEKNSYNNRLKKLHNRLETEVKFLNHDCRIVGESVDRVANTTCLIPPAITAERQLIFFDLEAIAVSAGSACSSGTLRPSNTLKAMNISDEDNMCAIRISTGWQTNENDIDKFIEAYKKLIK